MKVDDQSPLRQQTEERPEAYADSLRVIGARLKPGAGVTMWRADTPSTFMGILTRWVELDVLESRKELGPEQIAILRAEVLLAYAAVERDPRAAAWAKTFAASVPEDGPAECLTRARALLARIAARTSRS